MPGNSYLYPEKQEKVGESGYVRGKPSPIPGKIEKSKQIRVCKRETVAHTRENRKK